ncbi:MAG: glycosyltransferase [Gammaproteobacteria bacterium]
MNRPLRIVQVLPALNEGGVERGTVEFARELVKLGHESIVISNGGRQVERLLAEGTRHIHMPVHKKSLTSLLQVRPMRKLLAELEPDIVHVRSRIPAWIVWLAWRKLPAKQRPGLVSTFHGLYSVNRYSAIMGKAERVIAISDCVHQYILRNYDVNPAIITRIFRGLDRSAFNKNACTPQWQEQLFQQYPALRDKRLILMPGRLSRWKGQEAFIAMMAELVRLNPACHGVVVGRGGTGQGPLRNRNCGTVSRQGRDGSGDLCRSSFRYPGVLWPASVTCHMSSKAEPFGRTVPEALASGCPVVPMIVVAPANPSTPAPRRDWCPPMTSAPLLGGWRIWWINPSISSCRRRFIWNTRQCDPAGVSGSAVQALIPAVPLPAP